MANETGGAGRASQPSDPVLRRLERNAVLACAALAAGGLALGGVGAALGVLGGGVLVGASYWAIKSSIVRLADAIAQRAAGGEAGARRRPRLGAALALLTLRYALLGLLAYVMIARLRLHPVGLIVGASSIVAAAAIEAVRTTRT